MNVIPLLFKRLLAPSQTRIGGNRCLRYRLVFAAAVLWTGSASAANFHSYCATTSAELQGALDAAASFSAVGDSTIVSLVPGTTYKTTALATPQPFRYSSTGTTGYLWLSGDARYPCANASDTSFPLLDGDHTTPVLVLHATQSAIIVNHLIIQNGESTKPGAGLSLNTRRATKAHSTFTATSSAATIRRPRSAVSGSSIRARVGTTTSLPTSSSRTAPTPVMVPEASAEMVISRFCLRTRWPTTRLHWSAARAA